VFSSWIKQLPDGTVTTPGGYLATGLNCGIKEDNRPDLAILYSESPAVAAGVFTRNLFQAAPVTFTRRRLDSPIRALVVNSGNANACTGEQGMEDALTTAKFAARYLEIPWESVLVSSTGVIGKFLPLEKLRGGLEKAAETLSLEGGTKAAEAILTTDTIIKETALQIEEEEGTYYLGGMAKGSGMICPRMATMLAFFTTDLIINQDLLKEALYEAVERSFNLISIDGDTSTNDMVLVMANGASGVEINERGDAYRRFCEALEAACRYLAYRIVRDGEGTTKVIALRIKGSPDFSTAKAVARSVLNSLLVKTAFFGEDANWGRIFMAVGNAEVKIDPYKVDLYLGEVKVAENGQGVSFSEEETSQVLNETEVPVTLDLKQGEVELLTWGSDLSHQYVTINADYRT